MQIHHLRNATMAIATQDVVILVDPMLGPKGTLPTFTYFRFKAQKNPIIDLPEASKTVLDKVTHCLITHKHPDHIDAAGEAFLIANNIPVTCSIRDEAFFKKKGLNVVQTIDYWKRTPFLGGHIEGIPARHGYGFVAKPMGDVMGYYIELPGEKSIYLSSDTIYTDDVDKVLREYQPAISVAACGSAQLDIFKPLLMHMEDIIRFVKNSPGEIIANHLEVVNHCPTTRDMLKERLKKELLLNKVFIPEDGEVMQFIA